MSPEPATAAPHDPLLDRRLLATPARQSPIAFVFIAWRLVRRLGLSAIAAAVVLVTNGSLAIGAWFLGVVVAAGLFVFSALSWWRFTFCVVDDELVVTRGIASLQRLVIPLDRVQSVSIDQRLAHRFVGLVRAAVDTAGSSDVEFEIDAIDRPRAEALRRIAADARTHVAVVADHAGGLPPPARPGAPDEVVIRRSVADLVRVGITKMPWAGLAVLAPLVALGDELDRFLGVGAFLERQIDRADGVGDGSTVVSIAAIAGLVLVGTLLGMSLQVVRELLANWNLTLLRTSTGLRRTAGLLSTTSRSSTMRRVQLLTTDDTPPQRWLGITSLTLRTFGDAHLGLPGSRHAEVEHVRRLAFGTAPRPALDRSISRWSVFKATRNVSVLASVIAIAGWFVVGWWSLFVMSVVPIEWAAARRRWRLRRWGLTDDHIAESYEFVARHTGELPLFKAQVVSVSQSFFERRKGLATLRITAAGGHLAVPLIGLDEAATARDRILRAVETDHRRFL